MNILMCDFETRNSEEALSENKTYVWAWCLERVGGEERGKNESGTDIASFFAACKKLGNATIYFHNLKFDGNFIVDYLLRHGFKWSGSRVLDKGEFSTMITESGVWYEIKYSLGYRNTITVRDSLKKLPFKVDKIAEDFETRLKKLEIDYLGDREEGGELTDEERAYIENDVGVVSEVLGIQYAEGMNKMTIGADCLSKYIETIGGKKEFRAYFPVLDSDVDEFVRKAYRGGWCYAEKVGYFGNVDGYTADVNSLYPSMMHSISGNIYPIGRGVHYEGCYKFDPMRPLFVQRVLVEFSIKPGYLPTVQIKGNPAYKGNEWIKETTEPALLTLTSVDLELLFKHYDIISIEYIDGYKFMCASGLFDKYIDEFYEIKKTSKGAKRQLAKLYLNNLSGKFGMRIKQADKIPYLGDDGLLHFKTSPLYDKPGVYIPVAAFVTAYSRRFTIEAAQKNIGIFCYADTDSIHTLGKPEGIDIDDSELCCWKIESRWDAAKFVRQKTYAEHVLGDGWSVKCAGMDEKSKAEFSRMLLAGEANIENDFGVGLKIKGKKLQPKQVLGGVILEATDYTITEGVGWGLG